MVDTPTLTRLLIEVDPRHLDTNTQNHRKDLGDLDGLTDSVRSLGVLEPLLVAGDPDRPRIVAGHRRAAAAIAADLPTVPCMLLDVNTSDTVELASMLVENVQRLDLTDVEEMAAYEQLTALGLDVGQIAQTTGVDQVRIEQAVKASQSKPAKHMAQKAQLTIEQAAAFVEFEDDEQILDKLADVAQSEPEGLDHEISFHRQERARNLEAQRQRDRLTKAGVKILDDRPGYNSSCVDLRRLRKSADADKHLTVKQHQSCPGHVAHVQADRWSPKVDVEYFCSQPRDHVPMHYESWAARDRAYGPSSSSAKKAADMTDAEREKAKAERKRVIDGNKRWRAAAPVRQKFVAELVRRKTCPAGTLRYVAGEILARPNLLDEATGAMGQQISGNSKGQKGYDTARSFAAPAAKAPDKLLPLFLIGQWAASLECRCSATQTWRSPGAPHAKEAARYFTFLETCGYGLASIEEEVIAMCKPQESA